MKAMSTATRSPRQHDDNGLAFGFGSILSRKMVHRLAEEFAVVASWTMLRRARISEKGFPPGRGLDGHGALLNLTGRCFLPTLLALGMTTITYSLTVKALNYTAR
jgi:hypothetical protein